MIFNCCPNNDLYRILTELGHTYPRYDTLAEALTAAPQGAGVLALADDYPRPGVIFDADLLALVRDKHLRLYLEYPAALPGVTVGEPQPTEWERVLVASDFFAPALARDTILAQHGCWFLPIDSDMPPWPDVPLAVARVAGYNRAVYGLPDTASPILFRFGEHTIFVATSTLSQFVTGRYGPRLAWKTIWERLLRWVAGTDAVPALRWTPTVHVAAAVGDPLDADVEQNTMRRSVKWFNEHVVYSIDWKKGAIEGFQSAIDHEGRQLPRTWPRGDCTGETAMVFAYDWVLTRNPASRRLASQILDYVWSSPDFVHDDPNSPAYGLNNWSERNPAFYGDDNARVILPTLAAGRLLDDTRWDYAVLRCLLANLRTTGTLGFRRNRIDLHQFFEEDRGWQFFNREKTISYAPHYQAYLWAAYLWAYGLTGYEGFLDNTKAALRMTMDVYPTWRWTNGITQEMARMLLPLAFLVRLEDSAEHRTWLHRVAGDLLAQMQPCGAIRERLGPLESGQYAPPQSNEEYGTTEASLIQENGDPACDLLYTTNYAFLGLHEAAVATGDAKLRTAEDRLADFLCRIQVRSTAHPYLDGCWMRSFDDERWEYWGSSADAGWGAWSVEAGWTNTWIAAVLAMRQRGESLFNLETSARLKAELPSLLREMNL